MEVSRVVNYLLASLLVQVLAVVVWDMLVLLHSDGNVPVRQMIQVMAIATMGSLRNMSGKVCLETI